jgi:hypothetical protein
MAVELSDKEDSTNRYESMPYNKSSLTSILIISCSKLFPTASYKTHATLLISTVKSAVLAVTEERKNVSKK